MRRLLWLVLCAACFAQDPSNSNVIVVGNAAQPVQPIHRKSIQDSITRAGIAGVVIIPADWPVGESYTNPNAILIIDLRGGIFNVLGILEVNGVPVTGGGGGGGNCAPQCLLPPTTLVGGVPVQTAGIVVADATDGNTTVAGPSDIGSALGFSPANDAAVVHTSGTELIAGNKTFSSDLTLNGNLNIQGNLNLVATGPLLFSGVKQVGTPTCASGKDFCIYLDSSNIFRCLLSVGGFCNALSGTAGGDTAGSFPSPTVVGTNGLAIAASMPLTTTNSSKQVTVASPHQVAQTMTCAAASGSHTAYTCSTATTFTPAVKDKIEFIADLANTGAATIAVNGATAAAITKQGATATALAANDIRANQPTDLILDASGNWEMQGQLGNAPGGSGTVNNCASAGAPAYYSATGTVLDCPNGTLNIVTYGNGAIAPIQMITQLATSGTTHAYVPFGTESFVISSQLPASDVFSIATCAVASCTPIRDISVDAAGVFHVFQALQMSGNTIIQGSASTVAVNYSSAADSNAAQAGSTLRAGDVTGNGAWSAGPVTIRGGNVNGTGAASGAGNVLIQPGAQINASPGTGATEGLMIFNGGVYQVSGTATVGHLACFSGNNLIANCASASANQAMIGAVQATNNASYYVQTAGTITLTLDGTYTFAAGDFVCPSSSAGGTVAMAATGVHPCAGPQVGIAVAGATSGTTVSTLLQLSHAGDISKVANGTIALGTSAIASAACATATATATGALTTDILNASANADLTGVTGFVPSTSGTLTIYPPWLTSNTVNVKTCNNTSASITPGAVTLNWVVTR